MTCDLPVRPDQRNNCPAHEYTDTPDVLEAKVSLLAEMLKEGGCVVYSGAGLSRSAGIGDYASRAADSMAKTTKKLASPLDAEPTIAHCVIARLVEAGK